MVSPWYHQRSLSVKRGLRNRPCAIPQPGRENAMTLNSSRSDTNAVTNDTRSENLRTRCASCVFGVDAPQGRYVASPFLPGSLASAFPVKENCVSLTGFPHGGGPTTGAVTWRVAPRFCGRRGTRSPTVPAEARIAGTFRERNGVNPKIKLNKVSGHLAIKCNSAG